MPMTHVFCNVLSRGVTDDGGGVMQASGSRNSINVSGEATAAVSEEWYRVFATVSATAMDIRVRKATTSRRHGAM